MWRRHCHDAPLQFGRAVKTAHASVDFNPIHPKANLIPRKSKTLLRTSAFLRQFSNVSVLTYLPLLRLLLLCAFVSSHLFNTAPRFRLKYPPLLRNIVPVSCKSFDKGSSRCQHRSVCRGTRPSRPISTCNLCTAYTTTYLNLDTLSRLHAWRFCTARFIATTGT